MIIFFKLVTIHESILNLIVIILVNIIESLKVQSLKFRIDNRQIEILHTSDIFLDANLSCKKV